MDTETNLTQQQADALELAYPMHANCLQALVTKAEQTHGVTAQEKAAILALPCMCVDHLAGVA